MDPVLGLFLDKLRRAYEKRNNLDASYAIGYVLDQEETTFEDLEDLAGNLADTPSSLEDAFSLKDMVASVLDWGAEEDSRELRRLLTLTGRSPVEIDLVIEWLSRILSKNIYWR